MAGILKMLADSGTNMLANFSFGLISSTNYDSYWHNLVNYPVDTLWETVIVSGITSFVGQCVYYATPDYELLRAIITSIVVIKTLNTVRTHKLVNQFRNMFYESDMSNDNTKEHKIIFPEMKPTEEHIEQIEKTEQTNENEEMYPIFGYGDDLSPKSDSNETGDGYESDDENESDYEIISDNIDNNKN